MVRDEANRLAGRKPLALVFDGTKVTYSFDTMALILAFGIPDGMHLVIDLISFGAIAGDAGNQVTFLFDSERDDTDTPVFELSSGFLSSDGRGALVHIINAANTAPPMGPVDVYNTLAILDPSSGTSIVHFFYHFEEGGMDFSQEDQAATIVVRQIEPTQGEAGDQYFSVDIQDQIFIGE